MSAAGRFVSGFVSILGRPNAGKSTLLNALVGTKLAIVADKPQTTRQAIQGVLTREDAQVVFLDTPGIHKPASALNRRMMEAVRAALAERDLLLFLADATQGFGSEDREAVELAASGGAPMVLLLNKVDILRQKERLLPLIEEYNRAHSFLESIPISALTGEGLETLKQVLLARLPEGPAYFPPDHLSDCPERFLAAELIREKIIRETRQEMPYSVAVFIEQWEETPSITRISATIYVERDRQKGIIIGAKGSRLKSIGTLARGEIERLLGRRIFLELFVKVRPRWRENRAFLDELERSAISSAGE
jgi:GTP-binding protein Era